MISPHPAPLSPLAFTLAYQQYRSAASRIPFADTRLLKAAQFWNANTLALENPAYSTYRLEDIPPLLATLNPDQLDDLRPVELEEVAGFVERVEPTVSPSPPKGPPSSEPENIATAVPPASVRIWEHAAKQWLYVGELSRALAALRRSGRSAVLSPDELASILAECDTHDAPEIPGIAARRGERVESSHPALARWLRDFDAAWNAQRESGDANWALCLLVEYDANGSPVRGRLRRLEGRVDALKRDADSDEVIFHHQVKIPDDPFVGTVYAAFDALRRTENRREAIIPTGPRYRGRFAFDRDGGETYSGDSIGLSAFAVAFGDQWRHEVHRERRLISQTVAFTGGIGADGSVQPVSPDSLPLKVERAFHSPITHLVVPEPNRKAAEAEAERLRQAHPHRRLLIIGIERPTDIIADHNIFHTEKLWPGEFVIRKTAKYSRSVKVQVPVLVILCYLLLCQVYPRAWPWFDTFPARAEFVGEKLVVRNTKSQELWEADLGTDYDLDRSLTAVGNLDEDRQQEVCCLLTARTDGTSTFAGLLIAFDDDGQELFRRSPMIPREYPGDTSLFQLYDSGGLSILSTGRRTYIVTAIMRSYPARTHVRVWSPRGDAIGWYINAGYAGWMIPDTARDVLHCAGVNNRLHASCLFTISLDSSYGVSPPYTDPEYDLSSVKHGNQLRYIVFPKTDLCNARTARYNHPVRLSWDTRDFLQVEVDELGGPRNQGDSVATVNYWVNTAGQVVSARCSDRFRAAREQMVARGYLTPVDWDVYEQDILRNVRLWADTGWVSQE